MLLPFILCIGWMERHACRGTKNAPDAALTMTLSAAGSFELVPVGDPQIYYVGTRYKSTADIGRIFVHPLSDIWP